VDGVAGERKAKIRETLDASLAALVTGIREGAGVTQVELARRLNQPQSLVAKIETCARRISAVELLLVCRALGCDAGRLLADLDAAVPGGDPHGVGPKAASPRPGARAVAQRSPTMMRTGPAGRPRRTRRVSNAPGID
jgi:hypothetical protein